MVYAITSFKISATLLGAAEGAGVGCGVAEPMMALREFASIPLTPPREGVVGACGTPRLSVPRPILSPVGADAGAGAGGGVEPNEGTEGVTGCATLGETAFAVGVCTIPAGGVMFDTC